MEIVILDAHGVNPGDLTFQCFEGLGHLTIYEQTPARLVAQRIGAAEMIFSNKVFIDKEIIDTCPNLKYIGLFSTGYNIVEHAYAKAKGITVTNVPHYSTDAVAQYVFAMILHFFSQISQHHERVQRGEWMKSDTFCFYSPSLRELNGKTIGVIGYGAIGKRVCQLADAFGMHRLVYTRTPRLDEETETLRFTTLPQLLKQSDVVTLHCPLTKETKHMLRKDNLRHMKHSAFLINSSRGSIINEKDLAYALKEKWIAGAGVDVIEQEPMQADCPLLGVENCIITPHMAWGAKETRQKLLDTAFINAQSYLEGNPINVVG